MADQPRADHVYGGQAVLEGVMMRGRDIWAIAVRRPDSGIHVESHRIDSIAVRHPWLAKPGFRGVVALGQALSIGLKALQISAEQATPQQERLSSRQMGISLAIALVLFAGVFMVLPALAFHWLSHRIGSSLLADLFEGVLRVALFLGYLLVIGRTKEIRRVFQYHGAEHKTIAAYEHDVPLEPESVDRFSTLHVRCGTNFLFLVMILAILAFAPLSSLGLFWTISARLLAVPLIAAVAYELLRAGARFERSLGMRALMAPGLWLQKITTKPPDRGQIQVAIASFQEVLLREEERPPAEGPTQA